MQIFPKPIAFEWDKGNKDKNVEKHGVGNQECEEAFFDPHKKVLKDILHSETEDRYLLIGKTTKGKLLFIAFTIRKRKYIRIISARKLNRKETKLYEKKS